MNLDKVFRNTIGRFHPSSNIEMEIPSASDYDAVYVLRDFDEEEEASNNCTIVYCKQVDKFDDYEPSRSEIDEDIVIAIQRLVLEDTEFSRIRTEEIQFLIMQGNKAIVRRKKIDY